MSRSPHGERGLKLHDRASLQILHSRSPHGERGLKCALDAAVQAEANVAPRMGSVG